MFQMSTGPPRETASKQLDIQLEEEIYELSAYK